MEFLIDIHDSIYAKMGNAMYYMLGFVVLIGIGAQWRLYEKAGQPGYTCIIPVVNFIVFLRIVGRPANHIWYALIPVYGQLYFIPKVWIEICQSFGKRSMLDYILVIVLNGLYILNLGLSYDTEYQGPVYGKAQAPKTPGASPQPSLA